MRNPIQLLKDSFAIFTEKPALFVGIMLIPIILSILVVLFEPPQNAVMFSVTDWIVFSLLSLVMIVVNVLMGAALILAIDNRSLTVPGAYKAAMPFFWRYLGLSILMGLILLVGFILLIIPGVILSVWFAFATMVLILERSGIVGSLRRSREYVKGKWWGVFGRILVAILFAVLAMIVIVAIASFIPGGYLTGSVLSNIASFIVAPVMLGYMYLMYQDIKGGQVVDPVPSFTSTPVTDVPPSQTSGV
ncbi:MAG: YciC family protein [Candidatus Paceibacterota bacterium]